MINLFKKDSDIYAPVIGRAFSISKVNDDVFANNIMGQGIAIEPKSNTICSPCDGTITLIAKTKHAVGIKLKNGTEMMIHIGIDTVELNGQYFESLVKEGRKVKCGNPIIKVDFDKLKELNYDTTIMLIMINNDLGLNYQALDEEREVHLEDILFKEVK